VGSEVLLDVRPLEAVQQEESEQILALHFPRSKNTT
jgi:hypothetical protein